MHDFYPFDQPLYRIPGGTLPELGEAHLAHIRSLHFEQILVGPFDKEPEASAWESFLSRTQQAGLDVVAGLAVSATNTPETLKDRIRSLYGVTGILLSRPEGTTGNDADALMDTLRETFDCAFAAEFSALPEGDEDDLPEGTCLYPLYRAAYRRHPLPLNRLAAQTYFELLDAMQEADHMITLGSLPNGFACLRAKDCEKYQGLPLKALLMLHMTLTGTPILTAGEEFGRSALDMPASIRPKTASWQAPSPEEQLQDPDSIYAFARDMVALRSEIPALTLGGYQLLQEPDRVFAFARIDEDHANAVIVAINLSASRVRMPGSADVILSSYNRSFFDGTLLPFEAAILEAFPDEDDEEA